MESVPRRTFRASDLPLSREPAKQCELVSAYPPNLDAFQFVPTVIDDKEFKHFNPLVSFVVNEDGSVSSVKIIRSTGSPRVDANLVQSVAEWKYKPQPGCKIETKMDVMIHVR
jgi:TonB family protein